MDRDEHIEIVGADLAALITMSVAVEMLANTGRGVTPGHVVRAMAETILDATADLASEGLIQSAKDEAEIIAAACRLLNQIEVAP